MGKKCFFVKLKVNDNDDGTSINKIKEFTNSFISYDFKDFEIIKRNNNDYRILYSGYPDDGITPEGWALNNYPDIKVYHLGSFPHRDENWREWKLIDLDNFKK